MPYRLKLALRNRKREPTRVVVYGGTVFEVVDPFAEVQNLVVTKDVEITVNPGPAEAIDIDTWCLNHTFASPSDTKMRLTVLATKRQYGGHSGQSDLWKDMK